jgi:Transposase DDE domain
VEPSAAPPWHAPLAILTALTLRAVFRLAFRQTEGLIGSIVALLGLALRVPDHTTLSRRAATLAVPRPERPSAGAQGEAAPMHLLVDSTGLRLCGPGEWLAERHGTRTRRAWRKLHLGLDADTGRIVAVSLTAKEVDDGAEVGALLDQADGAVASFTADGGYDQDNVSAAVAERHPDAAIIVPPRASAVLSDTAETAPPLPFHPLRGRNLGQLRPRSATATSSVLPSTAAWPGRKHPATRAERWPRPRSGAGSR